MVVVDTAFVSPIAADITTTFLFTTNTAAAIIFMITSLALAYVSSHRSTGNVNIQAPVEQPNDTQAAPAPSAEGELPNLPASGSK